MDVHLTVEVWWKRGDSSVDQGTGLIVERIRALVFADETQVRDEPGVGLPVMNLTRGRLEHERGRTRIPQVQRDGVGGTRGDARGDPAPMDLRRPMHVAAQQ